MKLVDIVIMHNHGFPRASKEVILTYSSSPPTR